MPRYPYYFWQLQSYFTVLSRVKATQVDVFNFVQNKCVNRKSWTGKCEQECVNRKVWTEMCEQECVNRKGLIWKCEQECVNRNVWTGKDEQECVNRKGWTGMCEQECVSRNDTLISCNNRTRRRRQLKQGQMKGKGSQEVPENMRHYNFFIANYKTCGKNFKLDVSICTFLCLPWDWLAEVFNLI